MLPQARHGCTEGIGGCAARVKQLGTARAKDAPGCARLGNALEMPFSVNKGDHAIREAVHGQRIGIIKLPLLIQGDCDATRVQPWLVEFTTHEA